MKEKKSGFTLVELLIVMTIVTLLMIMAIGTINPLAMVAKAKDSERKSDLNKIKKAFEEYWNDKGYYPKSEDLSRWNVTSNCDKGIDEIGDYLNSWPCDPKGTPYIMVAEDNWFKVVTNLENKKDSDIPPGWYEENSYIGSKFNKNAVNYGVSSTNVLWYEGEGLCHPNTCYAGIGCNIPINNSCNKAVDGTCHLESATLQGDAGCQDPVCEVDCCGVGCNN